MNLAAEVSSQAHERVVVVGGGVIGAACAYYLTEAGREVTLIEQNAFGRGCSHGNCGYVCPSHVLPLAGPGAVRKTLKTLFQRNSPLKVRWRFDPAMWNWFWRFTKHCNERDMLATAAALHALQTSSRVLYGDLVKQTLADVEWNPGGLTFVLQSAAGMRHFAEVDQLLRDHFDLPATRYDGEALAAFEPALKPGLAGGWHYAVDAHLRPDKLMTSWRNVLAARGVEIREQCALRDFVVDRRQVRRVVTSKGELAADQVVIAAGAWTPQLNRVLRCSIPIQPGKGYSLTMPRPPVCPRFPMIFEEHRVAITPMQSGYRIGSTMEFAGYDTQLNPDRLQLLRDGAAHYLPEPPADSQPEAWWGWRPMTPDSRPLIGPLTTLDNVFLAAGHGMLGVSLSPATGRLVAELMTGRTPHVDPAPYRVDRR